MPTTEQAQSKMRLKLLIPLLLVACQARQTEDDGAYAEVPNAKHSKDTAQGHVRDELGAAPLVDAPTHSRRFESAFDPSWHEAVTAAIANDQYVPQSAGDGFRAQSPSQSLEVRFSGAGAEITRGDSEPVFIGGALLRAGGQEHELEPSALQLDACVKGNLRDARGECVHSLRGERGPVSELWENRPDGLEHTFVVHEPIGDGALEVEVRVTGARAIVDASGAEARLVQEGDGLALRYTGLKAWDANGKVLASHMQATSGGLSLVVDARDARYPVVIDPVLSDVQWSAEANQARAFLGDSVSNAGDVNADGFEDVIVGAPYFDIGVPDAGRAYLYLGGPSGLQTAAAWTADGDVEDANFGDSVAGVGDINDDGFDDIAVTAPRRENAPGQGRVYLYLGGPTGPSTVADWSASSVLPAELFGYAVARAGDVNHDGFDDVVIGARAFYDGQANEGRAIAFYGGSSGLASTPDWQVQSNQAGALLGDAVSAAGDVNNDGYDDVIVGAPNYDSPLTNEGIAFVYLGSSSGLSTTATWSAEGNQTGALFGGVVMGGGDVNGDSYDDVVVSAPNFDGSASDEGAVFLYLGGPAGPATTAAWSLLGGQGGAHFGEALGFVDVTADDRADLLIGAPDWDEGVGVDNGRAYLFIGNTSGLGGSPVWSTVGASSDDQLGTAVVGLDANMDDYGDVVVGAWTYDVDHDDEGGAFGYLGQAPVPVMGAYGAALLALAMLTAGVGFRSRGIRRAKTES
jgi:hypothetical protein